MKKDHFYTLSISRRKEKEQGFFQKENESWVLLKALFADFRMDGVVLVNKKYISSINRGDDEEFVEKVIVANNRLDTENLTILDSADLYEIFYQNKTVIQVSHYEDSAANIGRIVKVNDKSLSMLLMNTQGIWEDYNFNIRKEKIRTIPYNTHYIRSLLAYNKSLYQEGQVK